MSLITVGSSSGGFMIIYIVALFALLYFLMIRPQKKHQDKHKQMLNALKVNDRIQTVGGVTGYVRDLTDEYVYIEIAEGLVIELNRQYIAMVLQDEESPEEDSAVIDDATESEVAKQVNDVSDLNEENAEKNTLEDEK